MMRVLIAIAVLCIASVSAHVTVFPTTAVVGQRTYIYAQIPHSCGDHGVLYANNSIGVSVRIPANLTAQPMTKEGFTLTRTMRTLANGVSQLDWVTWMANSDTAPFPTWQLGLFGISVTFPAAYFAAGTKVWFQTIQYCDGTGLLGQSNWTLVTPTSTSYGDYDAALGVLGESSPSVTVTAATTLVTYVNTTSYTTIDNSDDWTTDSTLSVIAIILAALALLAVLGYYCSKPSSTSAPAPKAAAATPQQVPATTFVANGV